MKLGFTTLALFMEPNNDIIDLAKKHGFEINDLYALSRTLPDSAYSNPVHYYTPEGTKAFTNQVLSCIVPALGIEEKIEYT